VTLGFEVSGVVDEVCPTVDEGTIKEGDHVIVYPTDEEESTDDGYLLGNIKYSPLNLSAGYY